MISFKKIFVTLLLLCIGMAARAGNVVTISSVEGAPGEEVMVSLSLQNSDAVTALQVSIPIDEELTLVDGSAQTGSRSQGHSVTVGVKDGQLNVMVWSLSMAALTGNDGVVATWRMKLGNQPKTISLTPTKAVLTNPDGQNVETTSQGGTVQITCAKAQYSQMTVDFGRVPIRSTYHETVTVSNIGNDDLTVSNIIFSDVNVFSTETALPLTISPSGSEQIEITYAPVERGNISRTMQVVCNSISKLNTIELKAQPFAVNELHIEDATGISDGETTIHLKMNNMDEISGFQFEFQLPDALEYVNGSFTLSDRKADHQLVCTNNGGVLKAIAYSSSNQTFSGEDGELASFRVLLKGTRGTYPLSAQKAVLSATIQGMTEDVLSAKYGCTVTIASPRINVATTINMGDISVTEEATYSYTISNYGNAPLTVSRIVFDNENLSIDEALPFVIDPWKNKTITLRYNSVEQKPYTSIMQIYSNDPTQRVMNVNVSGSRFAPNYLNVETPDIYEGDNLKVKISADTYDVINGVQFDITYPKAFTAYDGNVEVSTAATNMIVQRRMISSVQDRYFCYFMDAVGVPAGKTELMTINFKPKPTTGVDTYDITISNVTLGTADMANKYAGTDLTSTFNVIEKTTLIGDVNMDGNVTIGDVVAIVNIISGHTEGYDLDAADANQDGNITVGDIVAVINIIAQI